MEPGYHRIGSVHAVIWHAGTNWAGPVRIQIYYDPECSTSFLILSDISGLLQICLVHISAADTELMNNHEIVTLTSFLELIFAVSAGL